MKIHDKFVIELAEVIKAYGNDYRVEEPFHLPCDYKFYEISGVAICEESFKKMKRLENEINAVLDKIRAEIEALEEGITSYQNDRPWIFKDEALQIIDKYKAESEDKE
jgi:hypothetical protein